MFSLRPGEESTGNFAQAVAEGLGSPHRRIPSRFLYDQVGSALFERICELPEQRMNRELGAGLDLATIEHQAAWVPERQRIEIHARFRSPQTIRIAPLERSFAIAPGERILTELSRKYRLEELPGWLGRFGFEVQEILRDQREWYALVLARRGAEPAR